MAEENTKNKLPDPQTQAQWFSRVREAHHNETTLDYVTLIYELLEANQEARLSDLARRLGVSSPTVSKILNRLKEEGYIESRPYRSIFLTDKGEEIAKECKRHRDIVMNFLLSIGVLPETARSDAEGMKHYVSEETLKLFDKFTRAQEYRLRKGK